MLELLFKMLKMEDGTPKTVTERWTELVKSTLHEIQLHLGNLQGDLDVKTVHQLRLAIKRLRVLLAVLRQTDAGRKRTETLQKAANKLFQTAGVLRDAQVRLALLEGEPALELLLPEAQKHAQKAEKQFRAYLKAFEPSAFNFKKPFQSWLLTLDREVIENAIWYLKLKYLKQIQVRPGQSKSEYLHSIRTALKRLVELHKIRVLIGLDERLSEHWETAKSLAQEIGTWHDHHLLDRYMTQAFRNRKQEESHKDRVAHRHEVQNSMRQDLEGKIYTWVRLTRQAFLV